MKTTNNAAWSLGVQVAIYVLLQTGCIPSTRHLPEELHEISGAVQISAWGDSLIALNDGGNVGRLWWITGLAIQGRRRALQVRSFGDSLPNVDWEALAYDSTISEILICDVGDNRRSREFVTVYRLSTKGDLRAAHRLRYPDGPHDCEACLYEHGTLTLITKSPAINGSRMRTAGVYRATLTRPDLVLEYVDSFTLRRRSVTDAITLSDGRLAVLGYNFRLLGPFPLEHTSIYIGTKADFQAGTAMRRAVRTPFTLAQYETLVQLSNEELWLASERTVLWPARWRIVKVPSRTPSSIK